MSEEHNKLILIYEINLIDKYIKKYIDANEQSDEQFNKQLYELRKKRYAKFNECLNLVKKTDCDYIKTVYNNDQSAIGDYARMILKRQIKEHDINIVA